MRLAQNRAVMLEIEAECLYHSSLENAGPMPELGTA
jgi:hypothetical protein